MTISEMIITAMVASPATLYIECNEKKYRDAIELVKAHGNRLVESAEVLPDHGIRITLKPELDLSPLDFIDGETTIDCGTVEAPDFPEELGRPDYEGGDLADAEEVLGANE